jgi:Holliday junction resolvase RusA-like endonuclease
MMSDTSIIVLPFPPSTNNLYRNAGRTRVPAAHYTAWRQEAGWLLASQRPLKHVGVVSVALTLSFADRSRHDADNCFKAVLDLLVNHQVIEGDDRRFVRHVEATWVDLPSTGVTVTVRGLAQ